MSRSICDDYVKNNMVKISTVSDIDLKRDIFLVVSSKRTITPIATAFFNMCKDMYDFKYIEK